VINAPPDGHTLLFATSANALSASFYDKANVNFARDITPVTSLVRGPLIMEVNPSFPAKTPRRERLFSLDDGRPTPPWFTGRAGVRLPIPEAHRLNLLCWKSHAATAIVLL
jgi:hypothetical protein